MEPSQLESRVFVPDGVELHEALARTTHLGIGAHPDDLEFMASHAILECFQRADRWFTAAIVTDGAGSPRSGPYAGLGDQEMLRLRAGEQRKAAIVGEYAALAMLGHASESARRGSRALDDDLDRLLEATRPEQVFTHNLADKHPTHVAVALRVIAALRRMPRERRPKAVYGCEVWRGLDWLPDQEKVIFDVGGHESLEAALLGVFETQIEGGKRYDLATLGRKRANATYHQSHQTDRASLAEYAMDLTPLILDESLDPREHVLGLIRRFSEAVARQIAEFSKPRE